MTSKSFNFLINTENYDTLSGLVKQLQQQIKKNETVFARIANIADEHLQYPRVTPEERNQEENGPNVANNTNDEYSSDEGDELRHYLDSKYKLNLMEEEDQQFSDVENPRLRQLLGDNAKLQKILEAKKQVNGQLLQIYQKYHQLLQEVILPRLAEDISQENTAQLRSIKQHDVEQKFAAEKRLWDKYHEYMSVLETVKSVNRGLVHILQGHLNREDIKRLEAQFYILDELVEHLRNGNLERKRAPLRFGHNV